MGLNIPSPNARGMMTMTETRAGVDSGSGCVTRSSAAAPEHLPAARPQREKQCNDLASLPYSFRCCEDALEDDFTRISGLAGMTTTPLHRASTPRGDRTSYETCTNFLHKLCCLTRISSAIWQSPALHSLNWREPLNQFIAYTDRKGERLSAYRLRRGMNISDMIC